MAPPQSCTPRLARLLEGIRIRVEGESARRRVEQLCAPEMAGRYPGSEGERRAAIAIRQVLEEAGLEPLQEHGAWLDPFAFGVCEFRGLPSLQARLPSGAQVFEHLRDYTVYVQGAAGPGRAEGPAVWLGRLESAPDTVLQGRIGVADGTSPGAALAVAFQSYLRQLRLARDLGLSALLRVNPPVDVRKVMIHQREVPSIPSLAVTPEVVNRLFGSAAPKMFDAGPHVTVHVPISMSEVESAGNVMAQGGTGPVGLVLCAHYDHLGALPDGRFFPGASDNASGVAVVLAAAEALARDTLHLPFRVVFLFTTGEETGLVGARRFVERFASSMLACAVVVCADEVSGHAQTPLSVFRGPAWSDELVQPGDEQLVGMPLRNGWLHLDGYSDDVAFLAAGFRRVATLVSRDAAVRVTHTLRDTPDRIDADRLAGGARALLLFGLRACEALPVAIPDAW